ncbi:MAG: hypothetical protein LBM96_10710 [Methanobrevibacter sp.]|jgi:hypothetical protein|nr:hypothetical protein [Candidatus Methanoflexus mossambicus]
MGTQKLSCFDFLQKNSSVYFIDSIMPDFKTYFYHLIDDKVDKTNNKIENYFLKTFPSHVKKIMKTFEGILSRIYLR